MNRLTAVIGVIGIATLAVYCSRLPEEFARWDFEAYRAVIYSIDPIAMSLNLMKDFTGRIVSGYYAPVSSISLMLDKFLAGSKIPAAATTASVNIVIHCINGVLLFVLLRILRAGPTFCGVAVFIFLLHPVQVESVMWFAQRKTVLGAMFCLLSWISFLYFRRTGSKAQYVLSLLAFELGMLSKPTYLCLPALLFVTEILLPQDSYLGVNAGETNGLQDTTEKRGYPWLLRLLVQLVPYCILSLGCAALAMATEPTASIVLPWYQRPFIAAAALWFYVGKLLVPLHLMVVYPRWHVDVSSWVWWVPLVGFCAAGALLWVFRNRVGRRTLWAMSIFLIPLVPAIGFFKFGHQVHSFVAHQFLYFSMIGAACLAAEAVEGCRHSLSGALKYAFIAAGVAYCAFLVFQTGNRAAVWNNTYTLWTDNSRYNPTFVAAPLFIGVWHLERGNLPEAERYARRALELDPKYAQAYNNLGLIRKKQGNYVEAEHFFRRALAEKPNLTVAVNNLARVLDAGGRLPEALELYRKAVRQKPDFPPVLLNLADALVRLNRTDEAIEVCERLVSIGSGSAAIHNMLGVLYMRKGERERGIRHFRAAVGIDPGYREARMNLDNALKEVSDTNESRR